MIPRAQSLRSLRGRDSRRSFVDAACRQHCCERAWQAAVKAGCEYAVVVTQGGTTSQRNAERLGFRVAYSKVTVIKQMEA